MKKNRLPYQFLTKQGRPTQNAVRAYHVYLINLPEGWNIRVRHMPSILKVRKHFGFDFGFESMIMCGLIPEWKRSQTALGRCEAMTKAYHQALSEIAVGVVISPYIHMAA